jgi:hypothetical protein
VAEDLTNSCAVPASTRRASVFHSTTDFDIDEEREFKEELLDQIERAFPTGETGPGKIDLRELARQVSFGFSEVRKQPAAAQAPRGCLRPLFSGSARYRFFAVTPLAAILGFWYALTRTGAVDPVFLPAPARALGSFVGLLSSDFVLNHLVPSLIRVGGGFLLSVAIAFPLGVLSGQIASIARMVIPYADSLATSRSRRWCPFAFCGLASTMGKKSQLSLWEWFFNSSCCSRPIPPQCRTN